MASELKDVSFHPPLEYPKLEFPPGALSLDKSQDDSLVYLLHKYDRKARQFVRINGKGQNAKLKRRTKALKKAVKENRRLAKHLSTQLTLLTTHLVQVNSHLLHMVQINKDMDQFSNQLTRLSTQLEQSKKTKSQPPTRREREVLNEAQLAFIARELGGPP
ncbi:hypothetical protein B0T21DRAFT_413088 [Apiosordaria backusii]|uniref:Uncharacterized protein n=1 Tax=Apiosordaria backusii TaxID=314023 RepID=A0AA40B7A1_9PEZI|nr:hypothetical protein B0T21DRAFT_413088 [Apiosordaria backusii]